MVGHPNEDHSGAPASVDHRTRGAARELRTGNVHSVTLRWAGPLRPVHSSIVAGAVGATVAALLVTRLLVTGNALDQVWAEDGAVYLADFTKHGLPSLGYVYAGYLQLPSRLMVLLGLALPLRDFSAWCVLSSSVVVGLLAAFSFLAVRRVTGSPTWAAVAGLSMALVPALSLESMGALANLQWFLIPAAFWALLLPTQPGARLRAGAVVVALAAALASPLAVFALPATLVHGRRAVRSWPAWALLVGLAGQVLGGRFAPATNRTAPRARHLSAHDVKAMVRGLLGPGVVPGHHLLTLLLVVLAVTVLAAVTLSSSRSPAAGVMLATALVFYGFSSYVNGHATPRYAGCASILIIGAFVLQAPAAKPLAAAAVFAVPVGLAILSFPAQPYRVSGPSWTASAALVERACSTSSTYTADAPIGPVHFGVARLVCRSTFLHF